ncbi:hypothetical protein [Paracoccus sp. KR1-242]|uniref:hypothetical protein n=1 Tax=Paracoccus sp. KR1-242 TaxID=3410028 RepID=UPI003C0BB77C
MDADKIKKLTEEIYSMVHRITDHDYERHMIERASKAIRDELPKPPRSGGSFNWKAVS